MSETISENTKTAVWSLHASLHCGNSNSWLDKSSNSIKSPASVKLIPVDHPISFDLLKRASTAETLASKSKQAVDSTADDDDAPRSDI